MDKVNIKKAKKISAHQIFQYLQKQKGFNLVSDKTFKQQHPPLDTVWDIFSFLCQELKDQSYSQLQPTLAHVLDSQTHCYSLQKMRQYIIVSSVFKKLGYPPSFTFTQLFKPEKDKFLARLYKLIGASKYKQKILKKYDSELTQYKYLKKSFKERKIRQYQLDGEISRLQKEQQLQKGEVQQREAIIQNLVKQITYKRKQKGDLMTCQQQLYYEFKKKKGKRLDIELQVKQVQRQNRNLQKTLVQNAPAIKKQRLQISQKLQKLKQQYTLEQNKQKMRFALIQQALNVHENMRNKSLTIKNDQQCQILEENQRRFSKLQGEKQEKAKIKEQLLNVQRQLKQKIMQNDKRKHNLNQVIRNKANVTTASDNVVKKKHQIVILQQNLKEKQIIATRYLQTFQSLLKKKDSVVNTSFQRFQAYRRRYNFIKKQALDLARSVFDDFR